MVSASSRLARSASRLSLHANLWCAGLVVSLLAASALGANEPTKPAAAATPPKASGAPVKIDTGMVQGVAANETADVTVFRGIPYAAPPVADLRWRPPQPAKAWE